MRLLREYEVNDRVLKIEAIESETIDWPITSGFGQTPPGMGKFEIGMLSLSAETIAPGEALTLNARISVGNVAYIYSELWLDEPNSGVCYGPLAQEFVLSGRNKDVGGVVHPVWDAEIELSLSIKPGLRVLTVGVDSAFAFMYSEGYGRAGSWLDGLFSRAGSAIRQRARLKLDSVGGLSGMLVYKTSGGRSMPHAVTLGVGDTFSPFVQILKRPGWQAEFGLSNTLTVRDAGLGWSAAALLPGDYLLGLMVKDLDGGRTREYVTFRVI